MLRAESKWPRGSVASQGPGRSQSHTSHSITRDGVTGKCQPTHKEEPSAHRIIQLPEGGAILHSHDSSLSTHTLFSLYSSIHFSFLFLLFPPPCFHLCFVCSCDCVCFFVSKIFVNVIVEGAAGSSGGLACRMFSWWASVPSVLRRVTGG